MEFVVGSYTRDCEDGLFRKDPVAFWNILNCDESLAFVWNGLHDI